MGPLDGCLRRLGVIEASRENAAVALHSGAVVLVFPGGDYDSYRPTFSENTIDFNGRTGYVRTAIEAGVPIVPTVSIGGQETQLFLTRGNWLARKLGLTKARMDILPVSFGFPFGLSVIFPPNVPLPSKIVTEVLEPIDITARFGKDPDVAEVDEYVRSVMQTALDRLAKQRRFPSWADVRVLRCRRRICDFGEYAISLVLHEHVGTEVGVKRLNGMDAMLLYSETPNLHTHTLKVAIIDPSGSDAEFSFDAFRHHLRRRLHLLEPLRYKLVDIPWRLHHPMWLENCEVDLDYHLHRVQVPAPGGRRELDAVIGEVASTPLDRSRPLWEFHFAEGLSGGRFALIGKIHHALADGVASVNLLARAMDLKDAPTDEQDNDEAGVTPTTAGLLRAAGRDHIRQIAELPGLVSDAAKGFSRVRRRTRERGDHPDLADAFDAPPTFLNHVVSPQRRFATAALRLADVKATAKALGITLNDLVLATAAGGLRQLLLRYDGKADRPIIASVPTATDKSERVTGNEISGLSISLPVHVADPAERAQLVALATKIAKEDHEILGPRLYGQTDGLPTDGDRPGGISVAGSARRAEQDDERRGVQRGRAARAWPLRRRPGQRDLLDGRAVPGAPVNITVWSYVDQLGIAVLTDDETFNDPHEATDALTAAFSELRSAAGLSGREQHGRPDGRARVALAAAQAARTASSAE